MRYLWEFVQWCAYRSPVARVIDWLAHLLVHGETPMQAVRRDAALEDRLDTAGSRVAAARIRAELANLG